MRLVSYNGVFDVLYDNVMLLIEEFGEAYAIKAIITEMDSYAYMRPMAQLFECRCGKGRVLFSSMGLQDLRQYPEARALLGSIYRYLASDAFAPEAELTPEELESLAPCRQEV